MISPGSGPPEEESSELSDVSSEELSGRPLEESTSFSEEDEDEEGPPQPPKQKALIIKVPNKTAMIFFILSSK